jgi:hypothetical protein
MNRGIAAATLALWAFSLQVAWSDEANASSSALHSYVNQALHSTTDVQFRAAETDLNRDGRNEIVVYVTSPEYCGSGGCFLLVLERADGGYRTVMRASITRLPIRVLDTQHHGWKDIGVMVGGGGVYPQYEAAMEFNGRRYPSNPTMPPAHRVNHPIGTILIEQGQ